MRLIIILLTLLISLPCHAQLKEYEHTFDIDIKQSIPPYTPIAEEYRKAHTNYDWKYSFSWDMPKVFDSEFRNTITNFGKIEKRIANADEDSILRALKRLPKETYPYIGPLLHKTKGLSGKILDYPGIKETKNKFPERIASVMKDIPNLEFVSPAAYIYLMPQMWGEDMGSIELPTEARQLADVPRIEIDKKVIDDMRSTVPAEDYALNATPKKKSLGTRHYNADINTPLSRADVKAFIATMDKLHDFDTIKNRKILLPMGFVIDYWETTQGSDLSVAFLKNMVNPCQSLVRKIKWAGLRSEFQNIIGEQAFGIDDWAYTCEKTIKAFRVTTLKNAYTTTLRLAKKGIVYRIFDANDDYTAEERKQQRDFVEATIQLYKTTHNDVEVVRDFKNEIHRKFMTFGSSYLGVPLILP